MSEDGINDVLFGPELGGLNPFRALVDGPRGPAPIPRAPGADDTTDEQREERRRLLRGGAGNIYAGGVINPDDNSDAKRKVLLGG
jgi:hypothetical protein